MKNDLISREALKKFAIPCDIHNGALTELCVPLYQIDNAPPIEYTFEEAFQKTVCEKRLYCPSRPQGKWIPITYRPVTDEEYASYKELYESWLNVQREECKMFNCPMPEDGQQILISTKYGVEFDTCYADDGYYLDSNREWEEVYAWMPLPEPYKKGANK